MPPHGSANFALLREPRQRRRCAGATSYYQIDVLALAAQGARCRYLRSRPMVSFLASVFLHA